MHNGTPEQAAMIRQAIEQGNGRHLLKPVLAAMEHCGSLAYTRQRAEEEADKAIAALHALPESDYRLALEGLAHISVQRSFDYNLWKSFRNPDSPSGFILLMNKRGHILSLPTG